MKTILLIESDESLRRRFRTFLEFEGFRVISRECSETAVEFLRDQPTIVDLVIAAVGPNGIDPLDDLLDHLGNTRVLLTTAGDLPVPDTPFPCLPKPVPPERLVSRAQQLLFPRPNPA